MASNRDACACPRRPPSLHKIGHQAVRGIQASTWRSGLDGVAPHLPREEICARWVAEVVPGSRITTRALFTGKLVEMAFPKKSEYLGVVPLGVKMRLSKTELLSGAPGRGIIQSVVSGWSKELGPEKSEELNKTLRSLSVAALGPHQRKAIPIDLTLKYLRATAGQSALVETLAP